MARLLSQRATISEQASQTEIDLKANLASPAFSGTPTGIVRGSLAADIIDGTKLADNAVDSEHYTGGSIDNAHLADDAVDSDEIASGAIDLAHMSSESVDEDNLHISNAGSNGEFLSKQSGNAGGLTWASAESVTGSSCFMAGEGTTTGWQNFLDGAIVPFQIETADSPYETQRFNIGSDFDNSTYMYTTPAAGVYMFGLHMYVQEESHQDAFKFKFDDTFALMSSRFYSTDVSPNTISHSLIVNIGSGVDVSVHADNHSHCHMNSSIFWGLRIT